MIWVIGDLHFNHAKLVENGIRPRDYERQIIKNWNTQVAPTDTVIVLGDIAWKGNIDILKFLKGKKVLVKGNHDNKSYDYYSKYFDFVCESFTIRYKGKIIVFSHKPLQNFEGDVNIHAHLHDSEKRIKEFIWCFDDRHYLVCLETQGYTVFSLNKILKSLTLGL